ncbi:DUF1127 domain-containing protein [Microvirga antarctica]|uniref:DUF1127 domain-containing protein n=1 Tax=Microvirga antarctica TaxID=2819233 RepID=UPI001FE86D60|nr:DUF1127 domain-containing protein [Microvirga antarctica]
MTHLSSTVSMSLNLTALKRVVAAFGTGATVVMNRWQSRREIRHLAQFDDRMLKDIGLTRGEVEGALAEIFLRDNAVNLHRWDEKQSRSPAVRHDSGQRPMVPLAPRSGYAG